MGFGKNGFNIGAKGVATAAVLTALVGAAIVANTIELTGDVVLNEQADHSETPTAGKGQIWVKNTTPNTLYFTDDDGTDTQLGAGGSSDPLVLADRAAPTVSADTGQCWADSTSKSISCSYGAGGEVVELIDDDGHLSVASTKKVCMNAACDAYITSPGANRTTVYGSGVAVFEANGGQFKSWEDALFIKDVTFQKWIDVKGGFATAIDDGLTGTVAPALDAGTGYLKGIDCTSTVTVNLPTNNEDGQRYLIFDDGSGTSGAGTNNITINAGGGHTIGTDDGASYVIAQDNGYVDLIFEHTADRWVVLDAGVMSDSSGNMSVAGDLDVGTNKVILSAADDTYLQDNGGTKLQIYESGTLALDIRAAIINNEVRTQFKDFVYSQQSSVTLGAAATALAVTTNNVVVTGDAGSNTIATITGPTSYAGSVLTLIFVDALVTVTDSGSGATANQVNLNGAFTSAADTVLVLVSNGTHWMEVSRSAN